MKTFYKISDILTISCILALMSSANNFDILYNLSKSLVPILLPVLVLYTTLSNFILTKFSSFKEKHTDKEAKGIIKTLRANVCIMIGLIFCSILVFVFVPFVFNIFDEPNSERTQTIIINTVTCFALLGNLYLIYDASMAFHDIYEAIENDN